MPKSNEHLYSLPLSVMQSYITVPAFIADYVKDECSGFSHDSEGLLLTLEEKINPYLPEKQQFVELTFDDIQRYDSSIVDLLQAGKIPFHITNDFDEDYEVNFWYRMDSKLSEKDVVGFACFGDTMKGHAFEPDLDFLKQELSLITTQLKMLNNDVAFLLEVRNIYAPNK